jgi:5'/3'-nucleotidase SurE
MTLPGIMRFFVLTALLAMPTLSLAGGLNILLTNDDGYDAEGIQSMFAALKGDGHNVTLVAPGDDESGQSAAISFGLVPVIPVGVDQFRVEGTPATCVLIGRTALLEDEPDLVVSGTNDGTNTGSGTIFSGTVGAATTGLLSIPSIAFSTNPPEGTEAEITRHFEEVAAFAVDFIAHLQSKPGGLAKEEGLLPDRLGLNINYPTLSPSEIMGVKLSAQGRESDRDLIFTELQGCPPIPGLPDNAKCYIPAVISAIPGEDVKDSDVEGVAAGYITVVPIDGDYTAPASEGGFMQGVLKQYRN